MFKEGCVFCHKTDQKWGQFAHVLGAFSGYHTPYMCSDCYNDPETYEFAKYSI